ncbi:hypothetical protein [Bacillus marinisedimentorum]|uniref:hypothetical protein n=1 Tax=Bacillus marinisedimentorum TaxID=1821260 RepID=UPI0012FFC9EA|nr:hypothetical protein [Bacillus marinisedimentorum]
MVDWYFRTGFGSFYRVAGSLHAVTFDLCSIQHTHTAPSSDFTPQLNYFTPSGGCFVP